MDSSSSSLGKRGSGLASVPNVRDRATEILSKQWDPVTNPEGIVNIGTAENHLMLDNVAAFIRSQDLKLQGGDLDYGEGPWGSSRLRKAMADFINKYFNPYVPIDVEHLTFANGCSSIFNMLGIALADPGDGILLSRPSYVAFASDFGVLAKMKPIYVPFNPTAAQFTADSIIDYTTVLETATASGITVRALMLCNPHNPLGQCYPPSTLIAILKFCSTHRIHLIVDEIYAMSVYNVPDATDTVPFTSILSLNISEYIDEKYVHFVYGMSKDFCIGGTRIGCLHTRNQELQRAVDAIGEFHWPGQVDQIVAATILEDETYVEEFLGKSREKLRVAGKLVRRLLRDEGITWLEGANAGLFLWVDLRKWTGDSWEGEGRLVKIMRKEKVFLTAGRAQGSETPGWFRLVFSRDDKVVREGMTRLVRALTGE